MATLSPSECETIMAAIVELGKTFRDGFKRLGVDTAELDALIAKYERERPTS
jgi:hypothetical protein